MSRLPLVLILLFPLLNGCGITVPASRSESRINRLRIDQNRQEVIKALGDPDELYGTQKDSVSGVVTSIDEYKIYKSGTVALDIILCPFTLFVSCFMPAPRMERTYYLIYKDDKLSGWQKETIPTIKVLNR